MSVLIFMWLVINFVHPFSLSLENRRELRFALKMKLLGSRLRSESNTSSESRLSNTPITLKADILNAWQNLQGSRSSANSSSFRKNSPEGLSRWMDGWLHTFWFAELWVSIQDLEAAKPGLICSSLTWSFTIHSLSFEGPPWSRRQQYLQGSHSSANRSSLGENTPEGLSRWFAPLTWGFTIHSLFTRVHCAQPLVSLQVAPHSEPIYRLITFLPSTCLAGHSLI